MEIGLFNLTQKRDPAQPSAQVFQGVLGLVQAAEDMGMDIAWFAEHHFSSYSLCVSPLMMAGWMAGQTKRIRLAPGVCVLPLYHPLRLIQEYEMLNLMSGNRIDFGMGIGYQDFEFERFGVSLKEAEERSLEVMQMFNQAIETGQITHSGKYFTVPECKVAVKSNQKSHRVFAAGGLSLPNFPKEVVRRGYIPFLSPSWGPFASIIKQRETLDQVARDENVDPANVPLAIMRFVHVTNSKSDAMEAAEAWRYSTRASAGLRLNYTQFIDATPADQPAANEPSLEEILANSIIGDPDTVAEKIINESKSVRATHFACNVYLGGLDIKKVNRSMDLLGSKVLPQVRRATSSKVRDPEAV